MADNSMSAAQHTPGARRVTITTVAVRLNGQTRHHFIALGSKSLNTWASARNARIAGQREFANVRVAA